jgi:hypothetical protein
VHDIVRGSSSEGLASIQCTHCHSNVGHGARF